MKTLFQRLWQKLSSRPVIVLAAGAFWTALLPVLYWWLVEKPTYKAAMWPGAFLVAAFLFLLGWAHPALYLLGAFLVGMLDAVYAHTGHFWRIGDLSVRIETVLDSSPGESQEFLNRFVLHAKFAWALLAYVALGVALGGVYWYFYRRRPARHPWRRLGVSLGVVAVAAGLTHAWLVPYPAVKLPVTSYEVYTRVNRILQRKEIVTQIVAQQPTLNCKAPYDHIVFVLGESASRDFMSAYGFDQPTTPFLDQLQDKVLARAIAPANQTMSAVPIIMTPATVLDYDPFYTSPSIVSDLKRCGYETHWYSNQLRYSPYTSSVSSIASEADDVKFVWETLHTSYGVPDGALLQLFSPQDIVPGRKQAYFFHLLGSHYDWWKRYPPDKALIPNAETIPEAYINTIYYTDQVLAQIFNLFQERSEHFLFIYTSDHAEWVTEKEAGHAHAAPFQEEYRVPLVFWSTRPEDLSAIAAQTQGHLVNTETLDLQVRYLLGLESDPGVSYSTKVLSLSAGRVREYTELPYVTYHETP